MPESLKNNYPSYLRLKNFNGIADQAFRLLERCAICPRKCGVNRLKDERGYCGCGLLPVVFSYLSHQGEEPPISGKLGSGTIFFSRCNMSCVYCQNYEFSQFGQGRQVSFEELAKIMLELQEIGCHNINLVTPTHVLPQILMGLRIAINSGFHLPLVYNTGGYELARIISLLEGVIDIYLPDMRYGDEKMAVQYSNAPGYPGYNQAAVLEMHRQVGIAQIGKDGIIKKGLIVRHLVLPGNISGTSQIMRFIAEELSTQTYISLMSQYLPYHRAKEFGKINRRLTENEYAKAKDIMEGYGLHNGWIQESYGQERFAGVHIKPSLRKDDAS